MLSENWRLTCGEAAWRLSFGLVGGSAALALSDSGATITSLPWSIATETRSTARRAP